MKKKRTDKEILEALKEILEISKNVKTLQQIAEKMGISVSKVRKSLEKNCDIASAVKKNLKDNKSKETINIVLDSSMISTRDLFKVLEEQVEKGCHIIMTQPTLDWLEKSINISDNRSEKQKLYKLEELFDKRQDVYHIKPMEEKFYDFSENICQFCLLNPGKNILYTANRKQYLLAKNMYNIPAEIFKKLYNYNIQQDPNKVKLCPMKRKEGMLYYPILQSSRKYTQYWCQSGERIDDDGLVRLHKGDNILICTEKDQFITFVHYRIYDPDIGMAKRVYSERISKKTYVVQTQKAEYLAVIEKILPRQKGN